MLKKFTTKTILLILILTGLTFYSCYEEPILEPVKRPYSVARVGNFTYNRTDFEGNIETFNIYIDGVSYGSVNVNSFTNYFDLPSGNRRFVLIDANGDTLYNKDITIGSYEETSVIFDGVYAPTVDTLMSFAPFFIYDGFVYSLEAPSGGDASIVTANVAPNTDTENQIVYSMAYMSADTSITERNICGYNTYFSLDLPAGAYTVYVIQDTTTDDPPLVPEYDTLGVFNTTFSAGMIEKLYITGDPKSPVIIQNQETPLAVRPK